jgi:bifunctional DNase/RNase
VSDLVPLTLEGLRMEATVNAPVMLLREQGGESRVVPIFIGAPEASAIQYAVEGHVPERPLTHDLALLLLEETGATPVRVVITEVRDQTFYAELEVRVGDASRTISCRPSDAVALAVRAELPILATPELLDAAGQRVPAAEPDADEILDEFHDFIETVKPEDFEA